VRKEFLRLMNIKSEEKEYRLDFAKWLIVTALVAVGVVGNSHFSAQPLFYRALGLIALAAVALLIAYNTEKGAGIWSLVQGSVIELRKVVWPSRQETNQTTLIVVAVVIFMSLVLWALDTALGFFASKIIG
jgi:preprotein translocase subunit SecE